MKKPTFKVHRRVFTTEAKAKAHNAKLRKAGRETDCIAVHWPEPKRKR